MGDKAAQPPETGKNSRDEGSRCVPCRLAPPGGSLNRGIATRYCFPVIASNISLTFVGTLYLTIGWDVLQGGKFGNWNAE